MAKGRTPRGVYRRGADGCCITAILLGTAAAPALDQLRTFRDRAILTLPFGAEIAGTYYAISRKTAPLILRIRGLGEGNDG